MTDGEKSKRKQACTFCKRRKIKCISVNDSGPCTSCIKFGNPDCIFLPPEPKVVKRRTAKNSRQNLESEIEALKSKLSNLESSVKPNLNIINNDPLRINNPSNLRSLPHANNDKIRVGNPSNLFNKDFIDNIRNNLNDIHQVHFDNDFNQLMSLVSSTDDKFSLFDFQPPIMDKEPAFRRYHGMLSWKSTFNYDPTLLLLFNYTRENIRKDQLLKVKSTKDQFHFNQFKQKVVSNIEPIQEDKGTNSPFKSTGMKYDCIINKKDSMEVDDDITIQNPSINSNSINSSTPSSLTNSSHSGSTDASSNGVDINNNNSNSNNKSSMFENSIPFKTRNLGLRFNQTSNNEKLNLINIIENNLPDKKIIWSYIDKFFDKFYCYIPIIDELEFKSHIARILNMDAQTIGNDDKIKLDISNKLDFTHLGILLIILRLGYLSLVPTFNNNPDYFKNLDEDSRYLLNYPINLNITTISHECLNQFDLFGSVNLSIFQLAMMVRFYQIYSPENGDGPDHGDAQTLNSTLFQMAYSLGLNRDPDKMESVTDEKIKNLCRKMWYSLLFLDLNHTLEYGDPLNANKFTFDTKLPFYVEGGSNLVNCNKEMFIIDCYQILRVLYEPVTQFINEILDVNSSINVIEFCKKTHYLKYKVFSLNGVLNNQHTTFVANLLSNNVKHIYKTKIELQFSYFISSLFFVLFNYFEGKKQYDLAFYYLHRFLEKILLVLFPVYLEFINLKDLEASTDFILLPGVESMLHKGLIFLFSILVRIKITVINCYSNPNHNRLLIHDENYHNKFKNLSKLFYYLDDVCNNFISISNAFSKKYYYGWIIARMNKHYLDLLKSKTFKENIYVKRMDFPLLDDNLKIKQLIGILEQCLAKKKKFEAGLKQFDDDEVNFENEEIVDDLMKSNGMKEGEKSTNNTDFGIYSNHLERLAKSTYDSNLNKDQPAPKIFSIVNPPTIDPSLNLEKPIFKSPGSDIFETGSNKLSNNNPIDGGSNNVDSVWLNLLSMKGQQNGFDFENSYNVSDAGAIGATPGFVDSNSINSGSGFDVGTNSGSTSSNRTSHNSAPDTTNQINNYIPNNNNSIPSGFEGFGGFGNKSGSTPQGQGSFPTPNFTNFTNFDLPTPNFNNFEFPTTPSELKENDFVTSFIMDELFKESNK